MRKRAIELLGCLEDAGHLESFSVSVWGSEVGLSTTGACGQWPTASTSLPTAASTKPRTIR